MKRWKCVSKIQLFQICCSILRPLSLANAVSQCPVSFLYLAGLDIMTNGWYWHIESSRLTHFPYWRCPVTRSHMMTCHTLREAFFLPLSGPKENIYRSTIYSNQFINQNPSKRLRRTKKIPRKRFGGIEKTEWLSFGQSVVTLKLSVTVITAKLWCHILLVRGVNWATELRPFYTEIVCRG